MWTCPKCNKKFKRTRQSHSCSSTTITLHFDRTPMKIQKTFEALMKKVRLFGPSTINSTPTSIHVTSDVTFLGMKPMKDHLKIDFYLRRKTTDFPIVSTMTMSKNRIVHTVLLDSPSDVTKQLVGWIKESYELVTTRPRQ